MIKMDLQERYNITKKEADKIQEIRDYTFRHQQLFAEHTGKHDKRSYLTMYCSIIDSFRVLLPHAYTYKELDNVTDLVFRQLPTLNPSEVRLTIGQIVQDIYEKDKGFFGNKPSFISSSNNANSIGFFGRIIFPKTDNVWYCTCRLTVL